MAAPSFLPETETITKGYRINVSTAGEKKEKKKTPKHGKRLSAKRPFFSSTKVHFFKRGFNSQLSETHLHLPLLSAREQAGLHNPVQERKCKAPFYSCSKARPLAHSDEPQVLPFPYARH